MGKKNWVLNGEIKSTERPVNSLLEYDLQFKSGIKYTHEITPQYNEDL
jgi:U3 small nucleolar ribonucleoprotein component